jgi:hypothetical protein
MTYGPKQQSGSSSQNTKRKQVFPNKAALVKRTNARKTTAFAMLKICLVTQVFANV